MSAKTPKPIEPYLPGLNDPDAKIRREAVKGLRQSRNPAALPHLIAALQDESVGVLIHAIRGLEALGDPAAIPPLLARLRGASCDVCDEVGAALVSFGDEAVPHLLAAVSDDPHPRVRAIAITCLRQLRADGAVEAAISRLDDPDPMVIRSALAALWPMKDDRAREPLARFIESPPAALSGETDLFGWRREAAFALAELGDERAIDVLGGAFHLPPDQRRCIDTIRQLGKIGSPAVRPLIEAYITDDPESTCASQARSVLADLDR